MKSRENGGGHLIGVITLFVIASFLSSVLLLSALLLFLSELLGSMLFSLLVAGGASMLIALLIYFCSLRPLVNEIREQLHTIYEVATLLRVAVDWLRVKLANLLNLI